MADYSTSTPLTTNTGLVYGVVGVSNTNTPILYDPNSIGSRTLTFTAPTGFSVVGSPLTGTGTISLGFSAGYSLPTTASQTNWDTAFSWGNHAAVGYLTSFTETDPVFSAAPASGIAAGDISNWNTAYGWGDHAAAGYLDEYEEGTWTPSLTSSGGSISVTYSSRGGKYAKVGNIVQCSFAMRVASHSGGFGEYRVSGLPFSTSTGGSDHNGVTTAGLEGHPFTASTQLLQVVDNNQTYIRLLRGNNDSNWSSYTPQSNNTVYMSFTYTTS